MATTTDIGRRTYAVPIALGSAGSGDEPGGAHMRVAMLTGGGDCPGLNAVMRAVARKGERVYGDELIGFLDGWKGVLEGRIVPARRRAAARHPAARRHDPRLVAHQPVQGRRRARSRCSATLAEHGVDALVAIGGEDTLGRRPPAGRRGRARGRRAEDDRQRPLGHRAHLRLRHRRADLRRRHRPPPHHRREPRPRDGRRGDGPPRRAHRGVGRDRRRRHHHADPRAALRRGGGVRGDPPPAHRRASGWRRSS